MPVPVDRDGNPLVPAHRARPSRRRGVEGSGHRRALPRRGRAHRAGVLHRRRGRRHPQPGGRHARGPGEPAPGPHAGARERARPRSATRRCTCSATTTRACPTPTSTHGPTTSPTPRSTRPSAGWSASSGCERPQVIVTYGDDRKFYPHPDHIRVHEISVPAFDAAGDPAQFPDAGPPWQPSKMYYTGFSRAGCRRSHDEFLAPRRGEPVHRAGSSASFPERAEQLHDVRRRRRLAAPASGRAARAPDPGRPRGVLDAPPRRRDPRGLPVGGVPAGASRSSTPARPRATSRTICSPGCGPSRSAVGQPVHDE